MESLFLVSSGSQRLAAFLSSEPHLAALHSLLLLSLLIIAALLLMPLLPL